MTPKSTRAFSVGAFFFLAALGGWVSSGVLSAPTAAIEKAMMRPCEYNSCKAFIDPSGGIDLACDYDGDHKTDCVIGAGDECTTSECCSWWKFWC